MDKLSSDDLMYFIRQLEAGTLIEVYYNENNKQGVKGTIVGKLSTINSDSFVILVPDSRNSEETHQVLIRLDIIDNILNLDFTKDEINLSKLKFTIKFSIHMRSNSTHTLVRYTKDLKLKLNNFFTALKNVIPIVYPNIEDISVSQIEMNYKLENKNGVIDAL